jgi:hypothetical protein
MAQFSSLKDSAAAHQLNPEVSQGLRPRQRALIATVDRTPLD